jgi:hypothetical protein
MLDFLGPLDRPRRDRQAAQAMTAYYTDPTYPGRRRGEVLGKYPEGPQATVRVDRWPIGTSRSTTVPFDLAEFVQERRGADNPRRDREKYPNFYAAAEDYGLYSRTGWAVPRDSTTFPALASPPTPEPSPQIPPPYSFADTTPIFHQPTVTNAGTQPPSGSGLPYLPYTTDNYPDGPPGYPDSGRLPSYRSDSPPQPSNQRSPSQASNTRRSR